MAKRKLATPPTIDQTPHKTKHMKQLTAIILSIALFTSCTKTPPDFNQTPVRGLFNLFVDYKQPNITSSLTKGDSTTKGGWFFDDSNYLDTMPHPAWFSFYVTSIPQNPDDVTGTLDLDTKLNGIHLADSVLDHEIVYYYIYRGTGTWHLKSQTGTLQNYFKSQASGSLTYEYYEYTKDADGLPLNPPEYHATLDGTGD
jgi:hypothetical protein